MAARQVLNVTPQIPQDPRLPPGREDARREAGSAPPAGPPPPAAPSPITAAIESVLAEARSQWLWELRNQFPKWRIWYCPRDTWHAARKGGNLRELRGPGAAAYAVWAGDHELLGVILGFQDAVTVPAAARQS